MTEDIVAMARAAQHDDQLSDGALYGKLADRIEALEARVLEAADRIDALDSENRELRKRLGETDDDRRSE